MRCNIKSIATIIGSQMLSPDNNNKQDKILIVGNAMNENQKKDRFGDTGVLYVANCYVEKNNNSKLKVTFMLVF